MDSSNQPVSEAELEAVMAELGPAEIKAVISPCPECVKNCREGSLRQYNVNLEDSMVLCDNDKCCYMADDADTLPDNQTADDLNELLSSIVADDLEDSISPNPSINDSIDLTLLAPPQPDPNSGSLSEIVGSLSPPQSSVVPSDNTYTTDSAIATDNAHYTTDTSNKHVTLLACATNQHPTPTTDTGPSNIFTSRRSCAPLLVEPALPVLPEASLVSLDSVTREPSSTHKHKYVMLWANIDALCWLDVLLAALVHNHSLRQLSHSLSYSSVVKKLLVAYDESQALIEALQEGEESLLHSIMEHDKVAVKRGGGYCMDSSSTLLDNISMSTVLAPQQIKYAKRKIHLAGIKLECVREEIWQTIEPPLRCERGRDDSPVFAFPLIVKTDEMVEQLFTADYTWTVTCKVCHHQQISRESKPMLTFPKMAVFEVNKCMYHYGDCVKCLAPNQMRELVFTRLSHNLVIHFSDGMLLSEVDSLSFTSRDGVRYAVSAVVEYKTSPNHFALWQRDVRHHPSGMWMCYDDLHSQYAQFSIDKFTVPASRIHIVFWEALPDQLPYSPVPNQPALTLPSADRRFVPATRKAAGKVPTLDNSMKPAATSPPVMSHNLSAIVERKAPAPALGSISKSLKVSGKNSSGQLSSCKKSVPLLSGPVGTKRSLTQSIKYGAVSAHESPSHASQTSSYKDILSTLSLVAPGRQDSDSKFRAMSAPVAAQRPKVNAAKSYLDIVKPLLRKNKEQNGKVLTGYVPKSKREPNQVDEAGSKRKRVMFRGVPSPTPPTSTSRDTTLRCESKSPTVGSRSCASKTTKRMQRMSLLRNDVPVRSVARQQVAPVAIHQEASQPKHVSNDATAAEFQSLEDILDELSY